MTTYSSENSILSTPHPTEAVSGKLVVDPAAVQIQIELDAAILAVRNNEPVVLAIKAEPEARDFADCLPFGHFKPAQHRTFEVGLRDWVASQAGVQLGYVEQLYSFGDRDRLATPSDAGAHTVSIGYLALSHAGSEDMPARAVWNSWYDYFPWEDWRKGKPALLSNELEPRLLQWADLDGDKGDAPGACNRRERLRICFGIGGGQWDEEKVLERYELLYEAGLLHEAVRDGREAAKHWPEPISLGRPMRYDHRRILATAISRIRAKIKYRPVIFELMSDEFTLFELQRTVEAILGPHLHKQNFRRLVESAGLVEATGEVRSRTGGRPAKLFRFRKEVVLERPSPGVRVKIGRM